LLLFTIHIFYLDLTNEKHFLTKTTSQPLSIKYRQEQDLLLKDKENLEANIIQMENKKLNIENATNEMEQQKLKLQQQKFITEQNKKEQLPSYV
jgi:hypothetical protein